MESFCGFRNNKLHACAGLTCASMRVYVPRDQVLWIKDPIGLLKLESESKYLIMGVHKNVYSLHVVAVASLSFSSLKRWSVTGRQVNKGGEIFGGMMLILLSDIPKIS